MQVSSSTKNLGVVIIVTILASVVIVTDPFSILQRLATNEIFQNLQLTFLVLASALVWSFYRCYRDATFELAQQKDAEAELKQNDERFRKISEEGPLGMAIVSPDFRFIKVNRRLCEMVEYPEQELKALTFPDITHPDDIDKDTALAAKVFAGEIPFYTMEKRYIKKNKDELWIHLTASVIHGEDGRPSCGLALIEDITERRRIQRGLQFVVEGLSDSVGEDFLKSLVRNLAAAMNVHVAFVSEFEFPENRRVRLRALWQGTNFGENFEYDITGTPCEHVVAQEMTCFPHNVQKLFPADEWLRKANVDSYLAIPLRNRNGQAIGHLGVMHTQPLKNPSSTEAILRIFAARCSAELERQTAETALRREKENYRRVVENINDALMIDDRDGKVVFANQKFLQMFGLTESDITSLCLENYVAPAWRAKLRDYHDRRVRGEPAPNRIQYEAVRKDGTRRWLEVSVSPVITDGSIVGTQSLIRDISQRKELERKILEITEQEKRRLGLDLHDGIGQQLTGIAFMVKALEKDLSGTSASNKHKARMTEIIQQVNDAISLTRGLARGLHPITMDNGGLSSALKDLAAQTENRFGIPCTLKCRGNKLHLNTEHEASHLFRIAQEAVHNSAKHGKPRQISINLCKRKSNVILKLEDDGVGMRKHTRNGPGLGLTIMRYRAREMNASLRISKRPGGGTVVTCSVPLVEESS